MVATIGCVGYLRGEFQTNTVTSESVTKDGSMGSFRNRVAGVSGVQSQWQLQVSLGRPGAGAHLHSHKASWLVGTVARRLCCGWHCGSLPSSFLLSTVGSRWSVVAAGRQSWSSSSSVALISRRHRCMLQFFVWSLARTPFVYLFAPHKFSWPSAGHVVVAS